MLKIMGSSKISTRYQITISEEVRQFLKLESGQTIGFVKDDDGKIVITMNI